MPGILPNLGDVVFHMGKGVQSFGIRLATECPFSHVSLVVDVENLTGQFWVLDVLHTRMINRIEAHASDLDWHVRSPRCRESVKETFFRADGEPTWLTRMHVVKHALELHQTLPTSYPYLELMGYLPGIRRSALGRRILRRSDRLVCSALVATAWHSMGLRWFDDEGHDLVEVSPDWVDPGVAWRQANRDNWPLVLTKKGYYEV